jgi:hypothetical protein
LRGWSASYDFGVGDLLRQQHAGDEHQRAGQNQNWVPHVVLLL